MLAETRPSNTQESVVLVMVVNDYTCKFSKLLLSYMYCTCVHVHVYMYMYVHNEHVHVLSRCNVEH